MKQAGAEASESLPSFGIHEYIDLVLNQYIGLQEKGIQIE
jgi:hypothetical protein